VDDLFHLHSDISGERFKSVTIMLDHGNRNVPALACIDIPNGPGFAGMNITDYFAMSTVGHLY
jgi:hypothetical protein